MTAFSTFAQQAVLLGPRTTKIYSTSTMARAINYSTLSTAFLRLPSDERSDLGTIEGIISNPVTQYPSSVTYYVSERSNAGCD